MQSLGGFAVDVVCQVLGIVGLIAISTSTNNIQLKSSSFTSECSIGCLDIIKHK